jgi:hypothetical protein
VGRHRGLWAHLPFDDAYLMPAIALMVLSKLGGFFKSLSLWQIICLGLAGFAIVQHFELAHERKNSAAWQKRYTAAQTQLTRISDARNNQKVITVDRIKIVHQKLSAANDKALVIEQAPPAKDCRTKPEVMGADL